MLDILKGLNSAQKEAVLHTDGPLLILAGAGSGKTRVITHRIAYLIQEKGIHPSHIIGLTFTNKAAGEMTERINNMLRLNIGYVWLKTFHSTCLRILKKDIEALGISRNFTLYTEVESKALIKSIIKNYGYEKQLKHNTVYSVISNSKDNLVSLEDFQMNIESERDKMLFSVFMDYEKQLNKNNALDFGDLLRFTVQLFRTNQKVLNHYSELWKYIMVDEYQDTNKAQYEIIRMLSNKYKNICVVGDEDQSIYSWRGADLNNILNFEKDFTGTKVIRLEQNYRSSKNILSTADALVSNNQFRLGKRLFAEGDEGEKPLFFHAPDHHTETDFIIQKIRELKQKNIKYSDITIFYRTNAQSRQFETALKKEKIPYIVVGNVRFYELAVIKDIIAYLKFLVNTRDSLSLKRIINVPARGIGKSTINKIEAFANNNNINFYEALRNAEHIGLTPRAIRAVYEFLSVVDELIPEIDSISPANFVKDVIKKSGYLSSLKEDASVESLGKAENIEEFVSSVIEFEQMNSGATIKEFLDEFALVADIDSWNNTNENVNLMTLHNAKGLEFLAVFIAGLEEYLLPHANSMDSDIMIEEERRLLYVGITRAKKYLYFTGAVKRLLFGSERYYPVSRFIKEIKQTIDIKKSYKRVFYHNEYYKRKNSLFSTKKEINRHKKNLNRVSHPVFGYGSILKTHGDGQRIDILFDGYTKTKTLLKEYLTFI